MNLSHSASVRGLLAHCTPNRGPPAVAPGLRFPGRGVFSANVQETSRARAILRADVRRVNLMESPSRFHAVRESRLLQARGTFRLRQGPCINEGRKLERATEQIGMAPRWCLRRKRFQLLGKSRMRPFVEAAFRYLREMGLASVPVVLMGLPVRLLDLQPLRLDCYAADFPNCFQEPGGFCGSSATC